MHASFSVPPAHGSRRAARALPTVSILGLGLLLVPPSGLGAQASAAGLPAGVRSDTAAVQEIRLVDGSRLFGTVDQERDPARIRLVSGDLLEVARARIRSVEPARGRVVDGEFWSEDPNRTRLFFGPTARPLRRGEGYVAAYELVLPFVAVGVTDDFLVSGGTPLFGGLFDDDRVYYLAPKVRMHASEGLDVSLGAFAFWQPRAFSDDHAGALYGVVSGTDTDRAATVGFGWGWDRDGFSGQPVVLVGGELRVGRTVKLLTESYLVPEGALLSVGPRFFGERLSADLGLGVALADGDTQTFPIVNFVYVF